MSISATENKKRLLFAIVLLVSIGAAKAAVELGIDVLGQDDYELLRGKRVGLITNQTGVDSHGIKTRVLLRKHCNLVALYTPEHGLDGTEKAGRYVKSRRDPLTGLTAYSLYGPTRKPTPSMLRGVDVLVFDIQDIGCRSYTYISTMGRCMETAAENNIDFVVLDRPNPLGGLRVEGPSVERQWISFVSQFPIPYVHGMTVGELAKMINAKGWINGRCNLTVVPMRGWSRSFIWSDTGLRWYPTSPNIPYARSPFYYVATGLVGELSGPETGVGGRAPFEVISASWVNSGDFTRYLQSLGMPGVTFREFRRGRQQGSSLSISPNTRANLTALGIYTLAELNRTSGSKLFHRTSRSKLDIFFKVYGSSSIRSQLERGTPASTIVLSWQDNVANFRTARLPFLLY
jgi:uncharacterized protein YbbC (DUF1343 family)